MKRFVPTAGPREADVSASLNGGIINLFKEAGISSIADGIVCYAISDERTLECPASLGASLDGSLWERHGITYWHSSSIPSL
jgi:hypothetical protein